MGSDSSINDWEQRKLGELGFAQSGVGFPDVEQGGTEGVLFFKVSDMNASRNENELVRSNNYVTDEQITRRGLPCSYQSFGGNTCSMNKLCSSTPIANQPGMR